MPALGGPGAISLLLPSGGMVSSYVAPASDKSGVGDRLAGFGTR